MLQKMIELGGLPTMFIFLSAFALIILGAERLWALYFKLSFNASAVLDSIRSFVLAKNYTEALRVCNANETVPQLRVVKSALMAVENGREAMRSALGAEVLSTSQRCEARLPFIALIAGVATLLGLLGTITGLIKTFSSIAGVDPSEKARLLGEGIGEAMYSTAAGLIVGIAALVVHTLCTAKSDAIVGFAQDAGFKVITWVEQSERQSVR